MALLRLWNYNKTHCLRVRWNRPVTILGLAYIIRGNPMAKKRLNKGRLVWQKNRVPIYLITLNVFPTELLKELGTLKISIKLDMFLYISFDLCTELLKLFGVAIFVSDHVFDDENLIVIYFIKGHLLKVFHNLRQVFPKLGQPSAETHWNFLEFQYHFRQFLTVFFALCQSLFEGVKDRRVAEDCLQRKLLLGCKLLTRWRHQHSCYVVHSLL